MASKAALVLLLVISLAGKTVHRVFVCGKNKDYTLQRIFIQPLLWHYTPNVNRALGATHTQRDSPEGSTRRGQRSFPPSMARTDLLVL